MDNDTLLGAAHSIPINSPTMDNATQTIFSGLQQPFMPFQFLDGNATKITTRGTNPLNPTSRSSEDTLIAFKLKKAAEILNMKREQHKLKMTILREWMLNNRNRDVNFLFDVE